MVSEGVALGMPESKVVGSWFGTGLALTDALWLSSRFPEDGPAGRGAVRPQQLTSGLRRPPDNSRPRMASADNYQLSYGSVDEAQRGRGVTLDQLQLMQEYS